MSAKRPYTKDSVHRALMHHELTGALHLVSPPSPDQPKFKVIIHDIGIDDEPMMLTLREAYALCIGLARGERHYGKERAS